jgi:hypothetical protein
MKEHNMGEFEKHDLERSLEQERASLAQSLTVLRDRLSPSTLVADGKEALSAQVGPMVSRLDGMVRAQPVVAAVAAVAVAALVLGRHRERDAKVGRKFEALARWEGEGGPPSPEPVEPEEEWMTEAHGLRERAVGMIRQIDDAARRKLAPAADLAKHRAEVVSALAKDTTAALGRGLESLSDTARHQAVLARERVYLARINLAETSRDMVEDHPLAVGAAAAVAGAAVAWMFRPTATEDQLMGDARDALVDDLRHTARSEVMKASDFARTLTSALASDLRSARRSLQPEDAWGGVRH